MTAMPVLRLRLLLSAVIPLLLLAACNGGGTHEGEGCNACHQGIEQAHGPIAADECTICHGGDPQATTREGAHVPVPSDWATIRGDALPPSPEGFIRDFAPAQLDALDPDYLRFINPSDFRVVSETCGTCHPDKAATVPTSVMATNAGHYMPTLYLAGVQQGRVATYGARDITDPQCLQDTDAASCALTPLVPPDTQTLTQAVSLAVSSGDSSTLEAAAYRHYLSKNCNTCHQSGFPRNNSPGLYRSTGCASCHMAYGEQGFYEGGDPTLARGTPVHPKRHELTTAIPTEQCASCHFQGGRIGLLYRGIREGGFSAANTPPNAVPISRTLYGHAPGYYFEDEDGTNAVDETPPDLHAAAGMVCADCHVGSDVHGDGTLYATAKHQVDLRCEDCHGTVREPIAPDADGRFYTAGGRLLPQLERDEQGRVFLEGRLTGQRHYPTQPAELLAAGGGGTAAMHAAMAPNDQGWSHTDSLTCDTCHTSFNQYCVGCHVSLDLRLDQVDYQTGVASPGFTRGGRSTYTLDHLLLGRAPDGRLQTVHPSQQVQMAIVGSERFGVPDGQVLMGEEVDDGQGGTRLVGAFRQRDGLYANNGFAPFFQHTTTRSPRPCRACHRQDDSAEELARVRGVYGHGTGELMLLAPGGVEVDGLKFLEDDGTPTTTWAHANTGPASAATRARALSVILGP